MRLLRLTGPLLMALPLTACYIGPGGICGPQTPIAYCQSKEEQDKLLRPKPYRDYWIKSDMNEDQKKRDWLACEGSENGNFSWDSRKMLPNETNVTSRLRQSSELKDCMTQRGYHYEVTGN